MKHARHFFFALALLGLASLAFAQVTPPGIDPTHYWTYTNLQTAPPQPTPIGVADQFYRQPIPVTVDRLERLLNWVRKETTPPFRTRSCTTRGGTSWKKQPTPRRVIVTNQFGSHVVQVNNLEFLLGTGAQEPECGDRRHATDGEPLPVLPGDGIPGAAEYLRPRRRVKRRPAPGRPGVSLHAVPEGSQRARSFRRWTR